ncbi:Uncharacterised protein [Salmonella enterica subsp. enterica serovar Bovismorbificans]|uniref:Uncharacterized protein n=1 Tax=Salmonella enterica subsp. enterica serovar Bovismorbificans TaxID=58097 RepID=A0A655D9K7_SALET|nr:Uncharacterised protein [Salmonella enterica subsp. enterica serovar Bovismorbificans]
MNSLTSPKRFASQPVKGIEIAFATPKEVITHVPWLREEPRFPAMVGIATLAMVESSTCMNVASDSAIVMMTSCAPSSGFCCCITRTSGLTRVSLYDVVDQFIDRREINFACVTFGNRRRSYLAGQYLTVAISGIHGDQRR